jgi:hypothetical protein
VTICYNFIKDATRRTVAMGDGIAISGNNNDSLGMRTGFRVYGNIIVNAERAGITSNNKDLVEIYHNVICRCGIGLRFNLSDAPLAAVVHNNIVHEPAGDFIYVRADTTRPWLDVSWDNNLYYPNADDKQGFHISILGSFTFSQYSEALNWDAHSLLSNPLFVSDTLDGPWDFRLQSGSSAVDAGVDVGIDRDFSDSPMPRGFAPDIGAHECCPDH